MLVVIQMLMLNPKLMFLHRLEEHFEEKKWIEISSKFFDRTGKRVNPIQLREKLG